jgi:hypothetical protein
MTRSLGIALASVSWLLACSADGNVSRRGGGASERPGDTSGNGAAGTAGMDEGPGSAAGATGSAGGGAPGTVTDAEACAAVTERTEPRLVEHVVSKADIIWVVDSSGSMGDEAANVQASLNAFVQRVESAHIDVHVVMLTRQGFVQVPPPLGTDAARFQFVDVEVGSNDTLQVLLDQLPSYRDFLRTDAATHFIVVTDDESYLLAPDFETMMTARLGHPFVFNAIASEDLSGYPICNSFVGQACGAGIIAGAAAPGCQHYALADTTGGAKISICTPAAQWPDLIAGTLGTVVVESIPEPLPCSYAIPEPPTGETLDIEKVNVEHTPMGGPTVTFGRIDGPDLCTDREGWYYDRPDAPAEMRLCPAACERVSVGGDIRIVLGCETVVLSVD